MTVETHDPAMTAAPAKPASLRPAIEWLARRTEPVAIGLLAILIGLGLFSLFILIIGKSPAMLFQLM